MSRLERDREGCCLVLLQDGWCWGWCAGSRRDCREGRCTRGGVSLMIM
jgi:hypothetical protein